MKNSPINISIARPKQEDRAEIVHLFGLSIAGAFTSDGIEDLIEDIREETEKQIKCLDSDFNSDGKETFYLIAKVGGKVAGTIAVGKPNPRIVENLHIDYTNVPEVKSVYILPEFQQMGIGSMLFTAIVNYLKEHDVKEYVLDAGYKKSQPFWIKKLGNPTITLKDFWGKGFDQLIWHVKLDKLTNMS